MIKQATSITSSTQNGSQLYAAKGTVEIDQDDEDDETRPRLIHDGWPRSYVAEDVIVQEERWCVFTPVNLGKWKICNIWFLTLSGFCVTLPVCMYLFAVCIRFFMLYYGSWYWRSFP
jgi:hypothetical protein